MHKNSGFSILELLTVIGILAVLSSIALPGLIQWRQKAQLGGATRDLYGNFQKAKMEAVKNNRGCTVAFNQGACDYVLYMDMVAGKVHLESGDKQTTVSVSMAGSIWIEQYAK